MKSGQEYPVLTFSNPEEWEKWLEKNHSTAGGVWLTFFKKNSGIISLNHDQALEVALCFGWIDSQAKGFDEKAHLQKFTPRRSKSLWSKVNTEHIKRLLKEGKMRPTGIREMEEAKKDGRWNNAYSSPKDAKVPQDLIEELLKDTKADEFFKTLNRANLYAIIWRLETAKKPETRAKRMKIILEMLHNGETFH